MASFPSLHSSPEDIYGKNVVSFHLGSLLAFFKYICELKLTLSDTIYILIQVEKIYVLQRKAFTLIISYMIFNYI